MSYDYEVRCLIESAVHVAGDGEAVRDAIPRPSLLTEDGKWVRVELAADRKVEADDEDLYRIVPEAPE